jgi:uncharacterized membrane protein YedE/YeeE
MKYAFLPLGALFGFLLSRAGATTYDYYAELFLFRDLQLMWVIAAAVAVGAPLLYLLRRTGARSILGGQPIAFVGKPMRRGLLGGSLMVGTGWGLTAACPGTVLAMLGEGKLAGLFTVFGIAAGTWLYGFTQDQAQPGDPAPRTGAKNVPAR